MLVNRYDQSMISCIVCYGILLRILEKCWCQLERNEKGNLLANVSHKRIQKQITFFLFYEFSLNPSSLSIL